MRRVLSPALWLRISVHVALYAVLLTLLWSTSATAAPPVPSCISSALPDARLAGQGSYRWFGLLIYDAQLWVGDAGFRSDASSAAPLALSLRYGRALEGRRIADASFDEMTRQDLSTPAQREQWRDKMRAIFPDVENGSRLTGIYLPSSGVRFFKDDQPLGAIDDPAFGPAFFAIWLSPATSAPALRQALLSGARPITSTPAGTK